MDKIELPVTQPPIICYLHHAYALAIILCHPQFEPWFFSNYIQLLYDGNDNNKFNIYSPSDIFMGTPLFKTQNSNKFILSALDIDYKTYINKFISEGYYFCTFVEEYLVPGKAAYKSYSLKHECLFYGYDNIERRYNIMGFDKRRIFQGSYLSYEDFDIAFNSITDSELMLFIQVNSNKKPVFDVELVKMQLKDYIESENTSHCLRIIDREFGNNTWGLKVFERLKEYFKSVMDGDVQLETRYLQILWEHKKCMLNRLKYMYENGYVKNSMHYDSYRTVERNFQIIRNLSLKFIMDKDRNIFIKIFPLIDKIVQDECDILKNVLLDLNSSN